MIKKIILTFLITLFASTAFSQTARSRGYIRASIEINGNDTIQVIDMLPVYVFKRRVDTRKYQRLIYNLKKVYPIAKQAKKLLQITEARMQGIKSNKVRRHYIKLMEDELKREYTPVLKKMSYSQGKLLIKLIDRETEKTTYEIVKELRGSFSAFFWQGVARIFTANLKDEYDEAGEDKVIEKLILLYEAGLL